MIHKFDGMVLRSGSNTSNYDLEECDDTEKGQGNSMKETSAQRNARKKATREKANAKDRWVPNGANETLRRRINRKKKQQAPRIVPPPAKSGPASSSVLHRLRAKPKWQAK